MSCPHLNSIAVDIDGAGEDFRFCNDCGENFQRSTLRAVVADVTVRAAGRTVHAVDLLEELATGWDLSLTTRELGPGATVWTLKLTTREGDRLVYVGDDLTRVIARAHLGGAPDRKESRYARD